MDNDNLALMLVLISAFMHAAWNSVVKAGKNRLLALASVDGTALLLCLFALPLVEVPSVRIWAYIGLSVVLNTIYRLFLIKAYEMGDFGQVYPIMRGIPPVLVSFVSLGFLDEKLSAYAWIGVLLISLGIVNLTAVRKATAQLMVPAGIACVAGLFVAGYTVVDAKAVRESQSVFQYIIYLTVFQSIPVPLIAFMKDRPAFISSVRENWIVGCLGGLSYLASYGLVLLAFSLTAVAKVSALRETSVIIAAVIGAVVFKEGFGYRRVISAVVILLGILLIKMSG